MPLRVRGQDVLPAMKNYIAFRRYCNPVTATTDLCAKNKTAKAKSGFVSIFIFGGVRCMGYRDLLLCGFDGAASWKLNKLCPCEYGYYFIMCRILYDEYVSG